MYKPPLTAKIWPVIYPPSSEDKNITALAMSVVVANLFKGIKARACSLICSGSLSVISVCQECAGRGRSDRSVLGASGRNSGAEETVFDR